MSRLKTALACSVLLLTSLPAHHAFAQMGGQDQQKQDDEDAKKKKRDAEWGSPKAPLPALRNAGPCPYVKVLYDAGRYVELKDNRESANAAEYTGEIQGISSACAYTGSQPITVAMDVLFAFGRGGAAPGDSKTYRYWVAVTTRNKDVLAKEYFDLPVNFDGKDRVMQHEQIQQIVIPRADQSVNGANFEVLIGFDVTPQMAAFNRDGKRFRVNAQSTAANPSTPTP
jgi:hypothetical protein